MNIKVTYDKETTELMEKWENIRNQYIKKLNQFIKDRPYTSTSQAIELSENDNGLRKINKQIDKLYKLSIPISIEIIEEHIHKFPNV